jgi:MoxR-like ATPase
MQVQAKFDTFRKEVSSVLLERDDELDIILTALLSGENAVLVGSPGTAKSLICDTVVDWMDGSKFSVLLNKFSKPEEVFGPVNVMRLKDGIFERAIDGFLPTADVAFLDEIFKASSAVLNTTLKVLNEHVYNNGLMTVQCPLKLCVAASNEWPTEAKELGALFDRFLFRKFVEQVKAGASIRSLMFSQSLTPLVSSKLSVAELDDARKECDAVMIDNNMQDMIVSIRDAIFQQGIYIGDRRIRKSIQAVKCYAWLNGNFAVTNDDLTILAHIWWSDPSQRDTVADKISEIAKPSSLLAAQRLAEAMEVASSVKGDDFGSIAKAVSKIGQIIKELQKYEGPKVQMAIDRMTKSVMDLREQGFQKMPNA